MTTQLQMHKVGHKMLLLNAECRSLDITDKMHTLAHYFTRTMSKVYFNARPLNSSNISLQCIIIYTSK